MDWANEPYILVYVRDTGDWLMWSWQTRALLLFLLRKVDRAGVLDLGKGKLRALAKLMEMPVDVLTDALEPLLEDGCIQIRDEKLIIPNFMEAQETSHSDRVRKQMSRERARSHALSQSVTAGHDESQSVTLASKASNTNQASESDARAPEGVTSERRLKSVPPPPPEPVKPSEAEPPPREPEGRESPTRPTGSASGDLAAYIRGKPKLSDLDVQDLADFASRMHDPGNVPLGMIREAIDDANDKAERGEARHIRHARVIGFIKHAKTKPRKPDPKPPAQVEDDDADVVARIRRGPKRMAFNDPRVAAVLAPIGQPGPQEPRQPLSESELADKARRDRERLVEADRKAGGT